MKLVSFPEVQIYFTLTSLDKVSLIHDSFYGCHHYAWKHTMVKGVLPSIFRIAQPGFMLWSRVYPMQTMPRPFSQVLLLLPRISFQIATPLQKLHQEIVTFLEWAIFLI